MRTTSVVSAALAGGREPTSCTGTAAVVARDPLLRDRMLAALATDGVGWIAVGGCDELLAETTGDRRPWDAAVLAWEAEAPVAVRTLRAHVGAAPGIVLVGDPASSRRLLQRALRDGCDGFVAEAQVESALAPTVRAVLANQVVIPRDDRRRLLPDALSQREKEVLAMVVLGYANGQIAERLFLAKSTVKSHLTSAFAKLGVRSRSEAAALILDPGEPVSRGVLVAGHRLAQLPARNARR